MDEAAASLGIAVQRVDGFERPVLTATEDGTLVGDDRRERRRRARRGLEREGGAVSSVDRLADPDAVDRFLELEASGWKGAAGTAIACDPATTAYFREICRRFGAAGRLEVRSLDVAGGPVAMEVALHAGDGVFHLKTAYDERYSKFNPGVLALVDNADRFAAEPVGFHDICTGGPTEMEGRVWPGRRRISTVVAPFASPVGRAVGAGLAVARRRRGEPGVRVRR